MMLIEHLFGNIRHSVEQKGKREGGRKRKRRGEGASETPKSKNTSFQPICNERYCF